MRPAELRIAPNRLTLILWFPAERGQQPWVDPRRFEGRIFSAPSADIFCGFRTRPRAKSLEPQRKAAEIAEKNCRRLLGAPKSGIRLTYGSSVSRGQGQRSR
jgi:hypothetical protein